ncbi:riboflavin synthase subunit alpha [Mesobacillus campisalis]|uniref:Riboflavin synthase n=1 Tax=Mesobacillus campisalis TaxID=1408103 RepID=A0A0M2STF6_9BACI|nr:riboflavin synthase [Mesobacillus campisalis]KKK37854.1 riboflavin synthase subunit alpha [Mesobacillus campisalis]
MFTGIIEEIGTIAGIRRTGPMFEISIHAEKILKDVNLGDSISINGVCLTVTDFTTGRFSVDVMPETVKATNIRELKPGSKVNLERAMAAGGRFGGHFVSGHVDGIGTIVRKERLENAVYYEIQVSEDLASGMIMKGSVTVDGTSLTIFGVTENTFTISLIPHTMAETIIGQKEAGDQVNIECDMIGKYVGHYLRNTGVGGKKQDITKSFLEENGFV